MDREGYFTARDIVDFIFCSRSLYFRYCIKAGKGKTPKMERGLEIHKQLSDKAKRAKIASELPPLPKQFGVRLYSEKYKFSTIVDCMLLSGEEAYPVEFKFSRAGGFVFRTHKYQMVAQALAIEDVFKKAVPRAYLKYSDGCTAKIEITNELRQELIQILGEMEEVIKFESLPMPARFKKRCSNCFYKNLCRRC